MDIYYNVGSYGPFFLLLLSIYLLWNEHNLFFYYLVGIVIDSLLNNILKGIIMQPRPCFDTRQVQLALKNNKRFLYKDGLPYDLFGMPSGHASGVIFSTLFVYFALRKTNWLYVYLVISFIVISERVVYNHHTISQVVVGSFLGVLLAYGMFELAQRKMKGRIREKPDDFGPL